MKELYIGKVVDEPYDWVIGELLQQGEKEEDYYIWQQRDDFPWSVYCGFGVFQVEPESVQPISEEAVKGLVFGCGLREKMTVKYKQLNKAFEDVLPVELPDDKSDGGDMGQLIKRIEQLEAQKEFLLTVLHKSILLPFTVMDKEKGKEAEGLRPSLPDDGIPLPHAEERFSRGAVSGPEPGSVASRHGDPRTVYGGRGKRSDRRSHPLLQ